MEPTTQPRSSIAIPIAIIFGFALIAIAIFFTADRSSAPQAAVTTADPNSEAEDLSGAPRPVDDTDYIRGNPNAPILIIEYSDYDCPFCKQYHSTLSQIMSEYGVTGKVAWVYRQFPIAQLHPNSPRVSEAALCVGELGGNDAFWTFTDLVFEEREANEATNVARIPDYVAAAGVDAAAHAECLSSGRMTEAVTDSVEDAFNLGARGTPYTVVMVGNQQAVINGAQSYDTVKSIVDNLIGQLEGTVPVNQTPTS
jgi:protein-disulfide isomerase